MEAGLADHIWTLEELVGLLNRKIKGHPWGGLDYHPRAHALRQRGHRGLPKLGC